MTIVAAWRHHSNNLAIASDSRISGFKEHVDHCVKIFPIPITIRGVSDYNTENQPPIYSNNLGIAFCGKSDVAYMIATAASILLSNVQAIPVIHEISMDNISEFVKLVFEKIITSSFKMFLDDSNPEIIVTGYCPSQSRIRAFKLFTSDATEDGFSNYFNTEILNTDGICFLGSGKNEAYSRYEKQTNKNPIKIIRELIESPDYPDIGGDIQFGDYSNNSFAVKGYQRPKLNNNKIEYAFAGLSVYEGDFSFESTGLHVTIPSIIPFMEELETDLLRPNKS